MMDICQRIRHVGKEPLDDLDEKAVVVKIPMEMRKLTNIGEVDGLDVNAFHHFIHVGTCFQEAHACLIGDACNGVKGIPIEILSKVNIRPAIHILEQIEKQCRTCIDMLFVVPSVRHGVDLCSRCSETSVLNLVKDCEHTVECLTFVVRSGQPVEGGLYSTLDIKVWVAQASDVRECIMYKVAYFVELA